MCGQPRPFNPWLRENGESRHTGDMSFGQSLIEYPAFGVRRGSAVRLLYLSTWLGEEQTSQRDINKEKDGMNLITRLIKEDDGQGMVEYTLVVLMVALVFWVGVKGINVGDHLAKG